MGKVGVGIITCDRTDMYDICIESIDKSWYDELVVVDICVSGLWSSKKKRKFQNDKI